MPQFHLVKTASRSLGRVTAKQFPGPEAGREYPVVGIFDSGTDPNNALLQSWVDERVDDYHPRAVQNNNHGSFVAGLIANGKKLNFDDDRFPSASAKIIDVVVFNQTGEIEESDLVVMITESLERFPQVRVWNLSLASNAATCVDDEMSEFGSTLDDLQEQYGVLFVSATGNLSASPLRGWPVDSSFAGDDRVAPPADSYRSLTVGGIAHSDNVSTCVKREQVSPFSRRGPGVGAILKPEITHYAGNCDVDGNYIQTGVVSLDGRGNLAEDIGVSFAVPLVTAIAGSIESELRVDAAPVDPTLIKAMIVHSAFAKNGPIGPEVIEYLGVGRPPDVAEILNCRQSEATVIFQVPAARRTQFYKQPFPLPQCLSKTGFLRGKMFMTVICNPPLDRKFGIEYCRRQVRATLGTIRFDPESGKDIYERQLFPAPDGLHKRYRHDLAELGLDWSPLKFYYRKFTRGPAGEQWRLSLPVMNRAEHSDESALPVTVLLTIRSDDEEDQVYSEMVRAMDQLGWRVGDLQLRSRPRTEE